MTRPLHAIVLAAGQGTRMKSARPKVLQEIAGKPMLGHVIDTATAVGAAAVHVVVGHGAEQVQQWAARRYAEAAGSAVALHWAEQREQLGTAHAVLQALPALPAEAQVLILYGDVPLTPAATLQALLDAGRDTLALLTTELAEPAGYGRIVRNAQGEIVAIVEDKDATPAQRAIHEINTGLMSAPAMLLRRWLPRVGTANAKGEYYLTDIVAMAVTEQRPVASVRAAADEVEGANDRLQLARLERLQQRRQAETLLRQGVSLADPERFDLRGELRHGRDVFIDVGCVLEGEIELGEGVRIGPHCVLRNVRLGAGSSVAAHSVLEDCVAGADCRIGPFARVRPGTQLGREVHIGNFVEAKNARIADGAKANHLAYIGDSEIGARTNIGAGVITCNYDGANKHRTVIGADVFVGSDTQLVAPVSVGDGATIAAGSTITRSVPPGGLTLARPREQRTIASWKRPGKKPKS